MTFPRTVCARVMASALIPLATVVGLLGPVSAAKAALPGFNGRIAISSLRDQVDMEIYAIDPSGTNATKLTNNADNDRNPSWSPDGGRIAFDSDVDSSGFEDVFVMDADGSNPVNLTNSGTVDREPSWSPDGTKIAFTTSRDGNFEIYLMDADGSNTINLTNDGAADGQPAWSPDGTKIAFSSNRDVLGAKESEIYTMNADGSGIPIRLTTDNASSSPDWSPDGARIVYTTGAQIGLMDADGANQMTLTSGNQDSLPAWSPDGAKIVFTRSVPDFTTEIATMNADGTGMTLITHNSVLDFGPAWQPLPLSIAASRKIVTYGNSVALTVHLYWFDTTTNLAVTVFKVEKGAPPSSIKTGGVDPVSGNLTFSFKPVKETAFYATWSGDLVHPPGTSKKILVQVRVVVSGQMLGFYGRSGPYALYHQAVDPRYRAKILPNHPRSSLRFRLQKQKTGGGWAAVAVADFRIGSDGVVVVVVNHARLKRGQRCRIRAEFRSDTDHLGNIAPWAYFRVTA